MREQTKLCAEKRVVSMFTLQLWTSCCWAAWFLLVEAACWAAAMVWVAAAAACLAAFWQETGNRRLKQRTPLCHWWQTYKLPTLVQLQLYFKDKSGNIPYYLQSTYLMKRAKATMNCLCIPYSSVPLLFKTVALGGNLLVTPGPAYKS